MEFSKFISLFIRNYPKLIISCLVFTFLFTLLYFFSSNTYIAEGTLYAFPINKSNQNTEVSNELNYARNIIALSNSPEFKKLLSDEFKTASYTPLVGIVSGIRLKEISPNILSLSVTSESEDQAILKFKNYSSQIKEFSNLLNKGNSSFELSSIQENPVVYSTSKNLFLFLMLGLLSGLFSYLIYIYFKK